MNKHKFRTAITFLMILSIIMSVFSGITLEVNASETGFQGSGTSSDQSAARGRYSGGPSYAKTGWLIYVMDEDTNARISPSTAFVYSDMAPPVNPLGLTTRNGIGGVCDQYVGQKPSYLLRPFDDGNRANGAKVKAWLIESHGADGAGAYQLIADTWGASFRDELHNNYENWVLCLEGVYWYNIFIGGHNTGVTTIETAYTLGRFQNSIGVLSPKGDRIIGSMTNGIFGTCAIVEPNAKFGIQYHSNTGRLTNEEMATYGYGMVQVWPNDRSPHT